MKFANFILLGFLAFAYANEKGNEGLNKLSEDVSSFQTELFDKVSQASEDFVKAVRSPYYIALKKSKEILSRSYIKIDNVSAKSQNSFNAICTGVEQKLKQVNEECINQYNGQYEVIKANVRSNLEQCGINVKTKLQGQEYPIEQSLDEINERCDEFRLNAVTCFNFNPVLTTECVFKKIDEYNKIIGEIGKSFNEAVTDVTTSSITLQRDVTVCNNVIIKDAIVKINEISKALASCS